MILTLLLVAACVLAFVGTVLAGHELWERRTNRIQNEAWHIGYVAGRSAAEAWALLEPPAAPLPNGKGVRV